jgi:acetyl esterase
VGRIDLRERLDRSVVRALGAAPRPVKRLIAGAPRTIDGLELDLDAQLLLRLSEFEPAVALERLTPQEARADLRKRVAAVTASRIEGVSVSATAIGGASCELPARLYTPEEAAGPGPLVVYYHGGGWVAGDLDTHEEPCRVLARSSGARVLSVDYRLAPEHPFPAPVEDALAAFRAAVADAERLEADPERIAVAGDSAGAHLAAVVAQQCAWDVNPAHPAPAFQLLIYPVVDLVEVTRSRLTFAEGFVLEKKNMDWYERQFIGEDDGLRRDPRVSPLLADDLAGVAPAMVVTAGFDPLRDEGEAYARRLEAAGVRVVLRRHPGYMHGFIHALAVGRGSWEALAEMGGALRLALAQRAPVAALGQ